MGCRSQYFDADPRSGSRSQRDGNERARPKFKQQQLYCEQGCGDRAAECGRHPCRGPRGEQSLSFCSSRAQHLSDQRSQRPAGRNDRPFRAKRSTSADGDRGGNRLQDRDSSRDAAVSLQDLLHGFGNAMSSNRPRSKARHQAHHNSTDRRNDDHQEPQVIGGRRDEIRRNASVKTQVRKKSNEPHEGGRDKSAHHAEANGNDAHEYKRAVRGRRRCSTRWR